MTKRGQRTVTWEPMVVELSKAKVCKLPKRRNSESKPWPRNSNQDVKNGASCSTHIHHICSAVDRSFLARTAHNTQSWFRFGSTLH